MSRVGLLTPCFVPRGGFLYTMIVLGGGFLPLRVVSRGGWFWVKLIAALNVHCSGQLRDIKVLFEK